MSSILGSVVMAELWRRGEAYDALLDDGERGWIERFWGGEGHAVWLIGRQRGKTFSALTMVDRYARSQPNRIIRYCAKTKDSALGIVLPNLAIIHADCPPELLPRREGDYIWRWPNGSTLILFGTDAESFAKGRGPRTDLQLLDECGFYQDLVRVENALTPALQTTDGKMLYLSTPPESLAHPYTDRINAARAAGRLEHDTFWNNPRVNHEKIIRDEASRLGQTREQFVASTYFLREYEARLVTESSRAAIPAWNMGDVDDAGRTQAHVDIVMPWQRPAHFDGYVAADWGGYSNDPHAALFGYLDFERQLLIIEDEREIRGGDMEQLSGAYKSVERELWGTDAWDGTLLGAGYFDVHTRQLPEFLRTAISNAAPRQPLLRVCDNNDNLQGEFLRYGYAMLPSEKNDKHLQVDAVNVLVAQRRIRIHPRCVRLIAQLYSTLWNKNRTEWERTSTDHGDLIDDLVYLTRNIYWNRDPRPLPVDDGWGHAPRNPLEDLAGAMTGRRRR